MTKANTTTAATVKRISTVLYFITELLGKASSKDVLEPETEILNRLIRVRGPAGTPLEGPQLLPFSCFSHCVFR